MGDAKWADVARYYAKSGITIQSKKYPQFKCEITHVKGDFLYGYSKSEGDIIWKLDECTPILRALEDMTEEEAVEFFLIYANEDWETAARRHDLPSAREWVLCQGNKLFPLEFAWLISKGFNVFGLEWGTECLRKGVDNGI